VQIASLCANAHLNRNFKASFGEHGHDDRRQRYPALSRINFFRNSNDHEGSSPFRTEYCIRSRRRDKVIEITRGAGALARENQSLPLLPGGTVRNLTKQR